MNTIQRRAVADRLAAAYVLAVMDAMRLEADIAKRPDAEILRMGLDRLRRRLTETADGVASPESPERLRADLVGTPSFLPVDITDHALSRFRRHHGTAVRRDVQLALARSTALDHGTVAALTQNRRRDNGDSAYYVTRDRRGVFVVVTDEVRHTVVTYLRMGAAQRDLLTKWLDNQEAA